MNPDLWIALQITLAGMAVVFASIFLLWLLMTLLVRMTSGRTAVQEQPESDRPRKRRAALAAVAVALARQPAYGPRRFPLPPTAIVSAWQAVTRANHLRRGGRMR